MTGFGVRFHLPGGRESSVELKLKTDVEYQIGEGAGARWLTPGTLACRVHAHTSTRACTSPTAPRTMAGGALPCVPLTDGCTMWRVVFH